MKSRLLILGVILFSGIANADSTDTQTNESKLRYTQSGQARNHSDTELTVQEKAMARQWMLTDSDWKKYKEIMKGPRGIWSPGLDPITALGVSETNESERKRYAEIWMRVESRKIELELAFEVERMAAGKRLHGDKELVDNKQWIEDWKRDHQGINQKVSLFVKHDCVDDCRKYFDNVRGALGKRAVLDIYFADGATSENIGAWAKAMNIDPEVVRKKRITLNYDSGTSDIMSVPMLDLPQVRVLDVPTGEVSEAFNK